MYAIGKRIRAAREQQKLSQKEFARRIGAKNTTVSNWEKGLTRPDVDMLAIICSVLGVSPDTLLDLEIHNDCFTEEEKSIIKQYRAKPHLRQAVCILLGIEDATSR